MILSSDEKERAIEYLKLSRKASQTGKHEILENISSDDKQQAARIFGKLRNQGILAYLSRSDELVLKKIKPFNLDYDWEPYPETERPEFDKDKCPKKCKGCPQIDYCNIRMREWKKSIDAIMGKKRKHPEGHLMAEEAIKHMDEFYKEDLPF